MKKPLKKCDVENCNVLTKRRSRFCDTHNMRLHRTGSVQAHIPIGYRNHGQKKNCSSTYRSWLMLRNRCRNPKSLDYKYYGGRGIQCCTRWDDFQKFREDMGDKPTPLHTIGRKNADKGYFRSNCQWETRKQQARSRAFCKLDHQKVKKIKALYRKGMLQKEIAKIFGCGRSAISCAVRGQTWA